MPLKEPSGQSERAEGAGRLMEADLGTREGGRAAWGPGRAGSQVQGRLAGRAEGLWGHGGPALLRMGAEGGQRSRGRHRAEGSALQTVPGSDQQESHL